MLWISSEKLFLFLRYLNFCPDFCDNVEKQLDKKVNINYKLCDVTTWETNNYTTHISPYLKK